MVICIARTIQYKGLRLFKMMAIQIETMAIKSDNAPSIKSMPLNLPK